MGSTDYFAFLEELSYLLSCYFIIVFSIFPSTGCSPFGIIKSFPQVRTRCFKNTIDRSVSLFKGEVLFSETSQLHVSVKL